VAATRVSTLRPVLLVLAAALTVPALPKDEPHPTAEEVLARRIEAMGGEAAIRKMQSTVTTYHFQPNPNEVGVRIVYRKAPDKFLQVERVGDNQYRIGFNGTIGWSQKNQEKPHLLKGDSLESLEEHAQFYGVLEPFKYYKKITYYHLEKDKEGQRHVLKFEFKHGQTCYTHFDAVTFVQLMTQCPAPGGAAMAVTYFQNYRSVEGVLMPFQMVTDVSSRGLLGSYSYRGYVGVRISEVTQVAVNKDISDAVFDPPEKSKKK
jgi:zinc protease